MRARGQRCLILTVAVVVIVFLASVVVTSDVGYAKGTPRSSDSSSSRGAGDSRERGSAPERSAPSASSSERASSPDRSSPPPAPTRSEPSREVRESRESGPPPERSAPPVNSRERDSSSNRSSPPPPSSRSETGNTPRSVSPPISSSRTAPPALETRSPAVPTVTLRSPETREPRNTDTRGVVRREYEDIGRIWKERQERRETASRHTYHYRQPDSRVYINYFPATYRYYWYDYIPGRVYPSIYCHYYGLFPPYVEGVRVVYVSRNLYIRYTYTDLPMTILDISYWDRYDRDYYYLSAYQHRSLAYALRDVERAWETGDVRDLMQYVKRNSKIDVFIDDDYTYTVDWQDYYDMTADAMKAIRTHSFKFYNVRQRNDRKVVAYGKHVYRDDDFRLDRDRYSRDEIESTVYVSYTFERSGDNWYITEVGSSRRPLH